MDEDWLAQSEEGEEDSVPTAGLGYGDHFWIRGTRISPYDCPDCLKRDDFDCDLCMFFAPQTCRLLRDLFQMQDLRTLFDIYRERRAAQRAAQLKRQRELIRAIRSELQAHGRPLHYAVLARMVADRHPKIGASEKRVLTTMASRPGLFERVAEGVYRCKKTNKH